MIALRKIKTFFTIIMIFFILNIIFFNFGTKSASEDDIEDISKIRPVPEHCYIMETGEGIHTAIYSGGTALTGKSYSIHTMWHNYGTKPLTDVKINIFVNDCFMGYTFLHCDADGYNDGAEPYYSWSPNNVGTHSIRAELDLYPESNVTLKIRVNAPNGGDSVGEEDMDKDGMPNDWEIYYGLNPYDGNDSYIDSDKDGYTNIQEYNAGTNPKDIHDHPLSKEDDKTRYNYSDNLMFLVYGILIGFVIGALSMWIRTRSKGKIL